MEELSSPMFSLKERPLEILLKTMRTVIPLAEASADPRVPLTLRLAAARYICLDTIPRQQTEGQLRLSETNSDAKVIFASLKISETESVDWALDSVNGDIVGFVDNAGHRDGRGRQHGGSDLY